MIKKALKGIFVPICTPFDKEGNVQFDLLAENVKKYAETELHGYLILGSNGENKSLRMTEKEQVIKTVLEHKNPKQSAMAASIFESTSETIEFAQMAESAGADYITLLPPSYFKSMMKDAVLIKYFTDAASAVHVPCLLYKAPQFSGGVDLSVSLIKECAGHPNIAGIKDSSSSGIEKIIAAVPENFAVFSGTAGTFFTAMTRGASGGVLSIANYLPDKAVELYKLIINGDLHDAVNLDRRIVNSNITISGSYGVAGVKCAMDHCGYHGGFPRLPLLPIPPDASAVIRETIEALNRQH